MGDVDFTAEYARHKQEGLTTEQALDRIVAEYNVLLRGSVVEEPDGFVRPTNSNDRRLCATNLACIALLNALFAKDGGPIFEYPFYIDEENPMVLKIKGINEHTVRNSGFVYVISDRRGFMRTPMGAWQYVNEKNIEVPYRARIDVLREDFTYPVYDVDNGIRLQ